MATAQGGVWKTGDYGSSWENATDVLQEPGAEVVGAVAYATADIAYAGTGRISFDPQIPGGIGLLKCMDAGSTWTRIAPAMFTNDHFRSIVVDPADPDVLLVTAMTGIWKSVDGGDHWTHVLTPPLLNGRGRDGWATRLEADPTTFVRQYAGAFSGHLFRSEASGDEGTWTEVDGPWRSLLTLPSTCANGNVCGNNPACFNRSDCSGVFSCSGGLSECHQDADCPAGQTCVPDTCQPASRISNAWKSRFPRRIRTPSTPPSKARNASQRPTGCPT